MRNRHRVRYFPIAAASAVLLLLSSPVGAFAEQIFVVFTNSSLGSFDSAAPGTVTGVVAITGLQGGESILAIDCRPATGQIYGLGSTSRLYTISPLTGAATQVGAAGAFTLNGTAFGFDFNPVVDRIRVVSDADQNLRLNPDTGALAATDLNLVYAPGDPAFGQNPNVAGAAYTNNVPGATTTTLFDIDSTLDILARQGGVDGVPSANGGQLFTVGPLGVNTGNLVGFDISGPTATAYASLTAPAATSSQLYTINLASGAATLVGTIGGGTTTAVADITAACGPPSPTPTPTPTATPTPARLPGDFNGDGFVDIRDYGIWRQNFGQTNCGNPADADGNCLVDIRDYGIWRQHFGEGTPPDRRLGSSLPAGIAPAPRGTPGPVLLGHDQAIAAPRSPLPPDGPEAGVPLIPLVGGLLGLGGLAGWQRRRSEKQ